MKNKIILIISLMIILGLTGFFYYAYLQITQGVNPTNIESVTFVVSPGDGVFDIGPKLEKKSLISHQLWFEAYVLYKGWGAKLQAGKYQLSSQMNIPAIAAKIASGHIIKIDPDITITIPEGFTLKQIDERLSENNLIKNGDLIARSQNLEGYLFPDTYRFAKDSNLEQIINKMQTNFDTKITEELKSAIFSQGKDLKDIIIMASIIEKEVRTDQDRKIVSGIFWQRIADKYPLQSCASIAYASGQDKWRYSTLDTKIDSPYNTYLHVGLPPAPICNPGLSSIQAAVYPEKSVYYFFLSKPDGETVFSKNLEEHNQNIARYLE